MNIQELYNAMPLVAISFIAIFGLLVDVFAKKSSVASFAYSVFGFGVVAILSVITFGKVGLAFNGMVATGGTTSIFAGIFSLAGIIVSLASHQYLQKHEYEHSEFYSLLLFAVSGMMLIAAAHNLLILFIGIEVMSVSFYILAGYFRYDEFSIEAGLKYFLLGAFATGFLLYGMSLLYGSTQSIDYTQLVKVVSSGAVSMPKLFLAGSALLIVGMSFKLAAFPFHSWAPDVYEGSPSVVTAFMSSAGKVAAFSGLIPLVGIMNSASFASSKIQLTFAVISAGSILYGNIAALLQQNIKRMLAFSSIAHAGYMLMGVVAYNAEGLSGIIYYSFAYIFMQIGAFVVISQLENKIGGTVTLQEYSGISKKHPVLAALMTIFLVSLAGIPPFAGFFGKYYLFVAAIKSGYLWLTFVAIAGSLVSVYFYLGVIRMMYFVEENQSSADSSESENETGFAGISLLATTVGTIVLGLIPSVIVELVKKAL